MEHQLDLSEDVSRRCPLCGSADFISDGCVVICINCNWSNDFAMFDSLPEWDEPLDLGFSHDLDYGLEIDEDNIF